ncbi:MAG TPA: beta-ketoacyl synthase N-terminal-like domain-containing protein, partial [Clostridia bacterium]|nr:beta-ketoacyl synthase N-terminal-like domain-containing protein [Clostridia bacterium]
MESKPSSSKCASESNLSGDNAAMEGTELNEIWEFEDNTNEMAYEKINAREQEKHLGKAGTDAVISASIEHVKTLMSEIVRIPPERLDSEAHFEELGLDSIMISQLNKKVEEWIGKSDVAMFFKYNCIGALGKYFAESYPDKISLPQSSIEVLNKVTEQPAGLRGYTSKRVPVRSNKPSKRLPASPASESCIDTDIAVIGISGRFPKAENMEQFWKNLYEGKDCIEEIPNSRWALEGFFEPDRTKAVLEGLSYSKWGGFLNNIDCFDPLFFNITPKDAMFMDPQERLFLEVAWECMEDSGYTRRHFEQDERGNHIGVFVGASFNNYQLYMSEAALRGNQQMYSANSQLFSIANRVSFVMNFTGPSLTVDTACSSSLYAVHLACDSIRSGQARMAIAGGVSLSLHPSKYIMLSQGQFSASDGRCRAFCEGGTGYVPAEAVCAVLLKPYKEAVKDRDHIYGVIKGTAANHGGKTNGYSVPNPAAQSETIEKALKRSGIHPRTISFIEAHGTGTALGDPIEMTGLTEAFRKYTEDTGFCSISSVKSNVGHAEAAAGVVQLAKVLLQLKHKTLVKNVMFGNGLNPNIDFTQTPFVVQAETEDWRRPVIDGLEVPRRAGISSFGAGGANAHIVVEEYIPENEGHEEIVAEPYNPAIIVLSARNEERLLEQVRRPLDITYERKITDDGLINLAYTLQVGREAMEERLALIARTIKELQEKLKEFLESKKAFSGIYRGQVKHNKEMLSVFAADEDMSKAVEAWLNKGKYTKILDLWVKGMDFDWNKLYGSIKPYRISLPSYPFARERYWVTEVDTKSKDNSLSQGLNAAAIHPMLHRNTSSLGAQRFSSNFTGREFFISDKRLNGQSILHGAVCLEMAMAAFTESMECSKENQEVIKLKNITWGNPVSVKDGPVQAHIGLYPGDNNEVLFEIYGRQEGDSEEPPVYSQGAALSVSNAEDIQMDIDVLKTQCKHRILTSGQCYEAFKAAGFDYGPGLMGIEQLYIGHEQVLIKLALPDSISDTVKKYILHPTFIDSAIQVCIGMIDDFICTKTALPYTLEEIVAFGRCRPAMWALVRYSTGSKPEDRKYDIDLCDDKGTVLIQLRGLLLRVSERKEIKEAQYAGSGTLMLEPYWRERAVKEALQPLNAQHLIVLCELGGISPDIIKTHMGNANCIVL